MKSRPVTVQYVNTRRATAVAAGAGLTPGYASKPGDSRRQGRVAPVRGDVAVAVEFNDLASHIEARLGVVVVGTVTHDPNSGGYCWAVFVPGMSNVPRPASDADKAKGAIAHRIREWCEAARLVSVRKAGAA